MHKKDMNVLNCFPGAIVEKANEPEEGEIVDDYELISSDEELCMRQRIRELEEENAEIEQIAVISRSYDIDRAARIPTDVSSISSTEFKTPKKRKRHKNKEHKKKSNHHHNTAGHHRHHGSSTHVDKKPTKSRKTRCKRREKLLSKKYNKTSFKEIRDNLTLDSPESLISSISSASLTDSDCSPPPQIISDDENVRDENDYYHKPGIRNTLRLAVARSRKNSSRQSGRNVVDLKERLLRKDLEFTGNQFSSNHTNGNRFHDDNEDDNDDDVVICEPENEIQCVPDDSADSLEEKELRLIALKSAVLKKHMDRKKRNAEVAYSPTDFDDIISCCVVDAEDKLADLEVVDLDEDDSQNGCISASPIPSPQLMVLVGNEDSQSQMVDCKPVDMDIANSDSEESSVALTSWNKEMPSSIAFPPPPPPPPYPPSDLGNSYPYGLYLPEFNTNSINPPPPGVDDYEEMKQALTLNFGKSHDVEAQDMDVENEEFEPIVTYPTTGGKSYNNNREITTTQELKLNSNTVSLNSNPMEEDEEDENQDEEEHALRALLLSKFNSPKNQKKAIVKTAFSLTAEVKKENSLEHQPLKDLNKKTVKPTEAILKEAVKRLKVVGMCKEEYRHENLSNWDQNKDCVKETLRVWDQQAQQDSMKVTPLPRFNISVVNNSNSKEIKENTLLTVECLKRKVNELKNHRETKVLECLGFANDESRHAVSAAVVSNRNKTEINVATNTSNCLDLHLEKAVAKTKEIKQEPTKPTNFEEAAKMGLQQFNCSEKSVNLISNLDEDTQRRLLKLKHEIINATLVKNNEPPPFEEITNQRLLATTTEDEVAINCTLKLENTTGIIANTKEEILTKKDTNIKTESEEDWLVDKPPTNTECKAITISKTKKPKLNVNQGTLEVTLDNTALKENNLNKVNKNLVPLGIKSNLETKKIVRTLVSIKTKETQQQVPSTNLIKIDTNALTCATTQSSVVKTLPNTYSVQRTTKIVKPNKVINTNVDLKRKVVLIKSDQTAAVAGSPTKVVKKDLSNITTAKPPDTSRLITSMDQVRHMCNVPQFVINIHNSSNETSDEEWADCDSMYKPLYDYNDISSPLSLHLESPCLTPIRSNSPIDGFEEKANTVKKTKRSPITFNTEITNTSKTPVNAKIQKPAMQAINTPVAVRHLPSAAQDEYRKLVNRMKLLENQRIRKESVSSANESSPVTCKENNESNAAAAAAVKPTLVKQVLLRNISGKTSISLDATNVNSYRAPAAKSNKANVLKTYESLYVKIGAGIVNNLDKSLCLVEEAKRAKINKLKLETRLKKLKAEMELLQSRHIEEEQKIARIYPSICSTNEVITSMKQKRSKVFKAAINLGQTLIGEEYRLNNELKQSITSKTRKLAFEIKVVNSLKAEDIGKVPMEDQSKSHQVKDMKNTVESDANCKEKCLEIENSLKLSNNKKEDMQEAASKDSNGETKNNDNNNDDDDECGLNSKSLLATDEVHKSDLNSERCSDDTANADGRYCDDQNVEVSPLVCEGLNTQTSTPTNGVNTEFQERTMVALDPYCGAEISKCVTDECGSLLNEQDEDDLTKEDKEEDYEDAAESDSKCLLSYTSPLEHLRNINGTVDPNGVVCPYDLMGNCEDASCKYVHLSQNHKDLVVNIVDK